METLKITILPRYVINSVIWSSSGTSVVTVTNRGLITAGRTLQKAVTARVQSKRYSTIFEIIIIDINLQ